MRIFTISAMAGFLAMGAPAATAAEASDAAKPAQQGGPLKPGRSAGIHAAQLPRTGLALVGASAIIAIVAVAAGTGSSSNGNNPQSNLQSVTTTTP
jgi:hypothetical protein